MLKTRVINSTLRRFSSLAGAALLLVCAASFAKEPFYLQPKMPLRELKPHYDSSGSVVSYKLLFKKDWSDGFTAALMLQNGNPVVMTVPIPQVIQQANGPYCIVFFQAQQGIPEHARLKRKWKVVIMDADVSGHTITFLINDSDKQIDYLSCSLGNNTDANSMTVGDFENIVGNKTTGDWMEIIRR